jgi:hypothetical protein
MRAPHCLQRCAASSLASAGVSQFVIGWPRVHCAWRGVISSWSVSRAPWVARVRGWPTQSPAAITVALKSGPLWFTSPVPARTIDASGGVACAARASAGPTGVAVRRLCHKSLRPPSRQPYETAQPRGFRAMGPEGFEPPTGSFEGTCGARAASRGERANAGRPAHETDSNDLAYPIYYMLVVNCRSRRLRDGI